MKTLHILFGFDNKVFEDCITKYLKTLGVEVESTVKLSKKSIKDFLDMNPSYDTAILLEVLNSSTDQRISRFSENELVSLTDERDINIVVLVDNEHKGSSFMRTLYGAGITSAIFQKGKKGGATPKEVAELVLEKRSRRDAREYYGLADRPIELDFLGNDSFRHFYNELFNIQCGNTLLERFFSVCVNMTQGQIADFIRRLPAEMRKELEQYQEYQNLCSQLPDANIPFGVNVPKNVKRGYPRGRIINDNGVVDNANIANEPVPKAKMIMNWKTIGLIILVIIAFAFIITGILLCAYI